MTKKKNGFKVPTILKITSRSSSITNAFVNGVIPVIKPTGQEISEALAQLGMSSDNMFCAYCGGQHETWDHFEPIVKDKLPTGYITELYNLIPCCNTCNSSKSGSNWFDWIEKSSPKSPKGRNQYSVERIDTIKQYEKWCISKRTTFDIKELENDQFWKTHWENHSKVLDLMKQSQNTSDQLREVLQKISVSKKKG